MKPSRSASDDDTRHGESGTSSFRFSHPRYEIGPILGDGGMAVVYRAHDRELGRPVAIKILRDSLGSADNSRTRLKREALALSRLAHPNVVAVHDLGERDGRLFLVMELVDGAPLDAVVRKKKPSLRVILRLVEKVARAVHHAHLQGIVHRDLKPANILVSKAGEPKVADFGLARISGAQTAVTRTGATLGTPHYMAPEQVEGTPDRIGPLTDVYALGAVLFFAVAGEPPHPGQTLAEVFARILTDEARPLREVAPGTPRSVEAIAARALAREPENRYPSAEAFADDIARYLAGRRVASRGTGTIERIWRPGPKPAWVMAVAAGLLIIVLGLAAWGAVEFFGGAAEVAEPTPGPASPAGARPVEVAEPTPGPASPAGARPAEESSGLVQARSLLAAAVLAEEGRGTGESHALAAQAAELASTAAAAEPELAEPYEILGRAREILGDWGGAEEALQGAVQRGGGPRARYYLGLLLAERLYLARSTYLGRDISSTRPEEPRLAADAARELALVRGLQSEAQEGVAQALAAYARGEAEEACRIALSALDRFPSSDGADLLHWAAAISAPNNLDTEQFDAALMKRPGFPVALLGRAGFHSDRRDYPRALADLDRALADCPTFVEAMIVRGMTHFRKGDEPAALADLNRAIELAPGYAPALVMRGMVHAMRQRYTDAVSDFSLAIGIEPGMPEALASRGWTRQETGDLQGAIEDYTAVLRLNPTHEVALNNRGAISRVLGDLAGSISDLDELLRLTPGNVTVHLNRSCTRFEMGDLDGALGDLDRALELEPGKVAALVLRGQVRTSKGDLAGAIADFTEALRLSPGEAGALAGRADVSRRRGNLPRAQVDLMEALRLAPLSPDAHLVLGYLLWDWRQKEMGIAEVERAIEIAPRDWFLRPTADRWLAAARKTLSAGGSPKEEGAEDPGGAPGRGEEKPGDPPGEEGNPGPGDPGAGPADESGRLRWEEGTTLDHGADVLDLEFSPDGDRLVSAGYGETVRLWNLKNMEQEQFYSTENEKNHAAALDPRGRWVAAAGGKKESSESEVLLWNASSGRLLRTFRGNDRSLGALAGSADGRYLAFEDEEGGGYRLRVWDIERDRLRSVLSLNATRDRARVLAFHPTQNVLAAAGQRLGGEPPGVFLWDLAAGDKRTELAGAQGGIWTLAFSRDGRLLAAAGSHGAIWIWDLRDGRLVHTLAGHEFEAERESYVWDLAFERTQGRWLASTAMDLTLRLWDVRSGEELARLSCPRGASAIVFHPKKRLLAVGAGDEKIHFLSLPAEIEEKNE